MLSHREFVVWGSSFLILVGHGLGECVMDNLGSLTKAAPLGWMSLGGTLRPSQGLFTSSYWIYSSAKAKRQESHPCDSSLLLSAGIFKVTVKGSDTSGCSGMSVFPLVITLHCPVPIHASDSWVIAAACLGTFWDEMTQHSRW